MVYKAEVTSKDGNKKSYIGMTEGTFKARWQKHSTDFRHEKYKHSTDLSSYIWQLKEQNMEYLIDWSILEQTPKYKPGNLYCALCVAEKRHILFANPKDIVNVRDEFVTKCRHQNKFKLSTFKHNLKIDLLAHTSNKETENLTGNDMHPCIIKGKQVQELRCTAEEKLDKVKVLQMQQENKQYSDKSMNNTLSKDTTQHQIQSNPSNSTNFQPDKGARILRNSRNDKKSNQSKETPTQRQNTPPNIVLTKKRGNRKDITPIEGKNNYQVMMKSIILDRTTHPLTPNTKTKYVKHTNKGQINNKGSENEEITTYSQRGRKIKPNQKYKLTDWSK